MNRGVLFLALLGSLLVACGGEEARPSVVGTWRVDVEQVRKEAGDALLGRLASTKEALTDAQFEELRQRTLQVEMDEFQKTTGTSLVLAADGTGTSFLDAGDEKGRPLHWSLDGQVLRVREEGGEEGAKTLEAAWKGDTLRIRVEGRDFPTILRR